MVKKAPKNVCLEKDFPTKDAAKLSGLTIDMVNYLCRYKIVKASGDKKCGRGRARKFVYTDILLLRVIGKLLSNGISVLRLRKSLIALQKRGKNYTDILTKKYVATDGINIYFKDKGVLEIFGTGQIVFAFVLELESIREELIELIEKENSAA